jgi:hypothetical protein
MSIGEEQQALISPKELLVNAINIMAKEKLQFKDRYGNVDQEYAGGQLAYATWAKAVGEDREFPKNAILPILFERIMCQNDTQVMVGEGRSYAAFFMEWLGRNNQSVSAECTAAADYFRATAQCAFKMNEAKGGFMQDEATTRKFAEPQVRRQIVSLILEAKEKEAKACELLKAVVEKL